ncbi:MAG: DUF3341 domain-containing protein [Bacteroidota bacterium]
MEKTDIIGIFGDEGSLVAAMEELKEKKVPMKDTYTPYPSHHIFEILERESSFILTAFFYGLLAVFAILAFIFWTSVSDWPINYGGKPTRAFPSFIVVTVILTILSITILSLFTFSIKARIYPGKTARQPILRSTDDQFVLVLDKADVKDLAGLKTILSTHGATEVIEQEAI